MCYKNFFWDLESEDKHDDNGSVEGVDFWNEWCDSVAQQGRHDGHEDKGGDGAKEDRQLVVAHGENAWNKNLHWKWFS